jgi:hypothetical protein
MLATHNSFKVWPMMMLCWLLPLLLMTATATTTAALQQQHRAWVIPKGVKFGSLKRLKLQTVAAAAATTPSNTSITVATRAVGLNFADIFTILGYYKAVKQNRGKSLDTFCPGLEFSGVVLDSDHCGDFQKGDRVFGFTRFGAYAKVVQVENGGCLRKLPDNWSHKQGAAFLVNALAAWHGLVTVAGMGVYQNKKVVILIHSAAGGVGLIASEIAVQQGSLMNDIWTEHGQIPLNQRPAMSREKIHVDWLLQGWMAWIFDTQTGRLIRVGACKRYAQPVNQRAAVCHLTSSSNGPFHSNPGLARCETLRQKQLDIPMRHHCCTSCANDLTKGAHKLTVRILTKKWIHHNNSWNLDQLYYDRMEVTLIQHNGWGRLLLHHITLETERDIIPRCGKHPNSRGKAGDTMADVCISRGCSWVSYGMAMQDK